MDLASKLVERSQAEREARIFELQMEQFWKNWAPDDKYEAARFQAELSSLVRQIYREAQEPLHKQMVVLMAAMPKLPFPDPVDERDYRIERSLAE